MKKKIFSAFRIIFLLMIMLTIALPVQAATQPTEAYPSPFVRVKMVVSAGKMSPPIYTFNNSSPRFDTKPADEPGCWKLKNPDEMNHWISDNISPLDTKATLMTGNLNKFFNTTGAKVVASIKFDGNTTFCSKESRFIDADIIFSAAPESTVQMVMPDERTVEFHTPNSGITVSVQEALDILLDGKITPEDNFN